MTKTIKKKHTTKDKNGRNGRAPRRKTKQEKGKSRGHSSPRRIISTFGPARHCPPPEGEGAIDSRYYLSVVSLRSPRSRIALSGLLQRLEGKHFPERLVSRRPRAPEAPTRPCPGLPVSPRPCDYCPRRLSSFGAICLSRLFSFSSICFVSVFLLGCFPSIFPLLNRRFSLIFFPYPSSHFISVYDFLFTLYQLLF